MSTSPVLRLDAYRGRREHRLRLARALHASHGERKRLLGLLEASVGLLDADRAAVLWVDEYGPGLVHVHALLDLLSDRPRRSFPLEPLRLAWQEGVPGILDAPDMERTEIPILHESVRSACAVALGSDGARAWFLVADGSAPRRPLVPDAAQTLMFVAGEVAAIVLHRDMEEGDADSGEGEGFAGWGVLRDMEGREQDADAGRRISGRFLVVRALLVATEDDFASDPDALAHQIEATRSELAEVLPGDPERSRWEALLAALEDRDLEALAAESLGLAGEVEAMGHNHGAGTLYRAAWDAAVAAGDAATAVEAGRLLARLERRRGSWDGALHWYGVTRDVARERGDRAKEAVVLSGWGSVLRDKGNLPGARSIFLEGLDAARDSGDAYALGSTHHDLMAVEQDAGALGRAIIHGWRAVEVYPEEESRLHAMAALAGCFLQTGELDAADDAYSIVEARVEHPEYRFAAREGLAYVAARKGSPEVFEERVAASDASGWADHAGVWTRAQILLFRGLGYQALGRTDEAGVWLEKARTFSERHGVSKVMFDAEAALERLSEKTAGGDPPDVSPPEEMPEIRRGLSAMREALVVA